MFVLVHKNRVLVGPMNWNRAMFDGNLEKLKILKTLPRNPPAQLPMVIDENTKIYRAEFDYPEHNEKIHYLEGPYWNFTEDTATATYQVRDKPLESVKAWLKEQVAAERWNQETKGINIEIQNNTVFVTTERTIRDQYLQKYLAMADGDTINWKFKENWLTLTKNELKSIVDQIQAHVQSTFDWEMTKNQEIDQCQNLSEADLVSITKE